VTIGGVILNQVASEKHVGLIRPAFERVGIRLLGSLRRTADIRLSERHLGLVQAGETADQEQRLSLLASLIEASVDLDAVVALGAPLRATRPGEEAQPAVPPPGQRIALARDEAFSFTYNHVLRGWRQAGAEIMPFSPLADEAPRADADAVWLPGGYPELHAGRIAAARRFLDGVRSLAENAVPVHGECGGYMVLGQGLVDAEGQRHVMAGLLRAETSFRERKLHLGYRRAALLSDCVLGRAGDEVFGHEFHYATLLSDGGEPLLATAGEQVPSMAGSRAGSVTGSFFHVLSSGAR
jgi:cobyrinic acid a,c-diamide synthase